VKLIFQDHKEYDDKKLYGFARSGVWRLLSKSDPAKITKLIQAECHFGEEVIKKPFHKTSYYLQVEKN